MKMEHVTIQTGCLEESISFYENIVGLKIQRDLRGKGDMNIVFLGNSSEETYIELIENEGVQFEGRGISLGFHSDEVRSLHDALGKKGFEPTPMISPIPGTEFFFVEDPNGVSVQFIQE